LPKQNEPELYAAFIELNDLMINEFYQNSECRLWNNFRLIAIDGSRLQLPISKEIIEIFGCSKNNHKTKLPASPSIS